MENRNIIIILVAIIVVLAFIAGLIFSQSITKEDSTLVIENKNLSVGDSLLVKLTDDNGNPISNEKIHITLTDKDGIKIEEDETTNIYGKVKVKMEEKGTYFVKCGFDGNNQYSPCSVTGNVDVKKATTELVSEEQTSTTTHNSKYAPNGGIYPEYGPEVDSQGITREYAIAHDMHYIEMNVDGDRPGEYITVGGYVSYDPNAGCYHT